MFLYVDFVELLLTINETPNLDNSKTAPDAGLLEIAERLPPRAPKAPAIDSYLEFPVSFSKLQLIASVTLCALMNNGTKTISNFDMTFIKNYLDPLPPDPTEDPPPDEELLTLPDGGEDGLEKLLLVLLGVL